MAGQSEAKTIEELVASIELTARVLGTMTDDFGISSFLGDQCRRASVLLFALARVVQQFNGGCDSSAAVDLLRDVRDTR